MTPGRIGAVALLGALASACGHVPPKPSPTHIRADEARAPAEIPAPVQLSPMLPKPKPSARPETYSVVVNNVRIHELLFALARDARLNVDIHADVTGSVTLNAIDQTLPQLLARIARQVDMRYEIHGDNLVVMRDSPFLRTYKVDYLSASRNVKMQSNASTQFGTGGGGTGTGAATSTTGGTAQIDVIAENKLWESLVQNVKDILRETDKIIPAGTQLATSAPPPAPAPGTAPQPTGAAAPAPMATYQEASSVIGNRESGVLYVRASSKQHEKVLEFLDQVLAGAKRQVLIEATVAEVQLRNEYQRGIDWSRTRRIGEATGFELRQREIAPTTSVTPGFNPLPFLINYTSGGRNFAATLRLLEEFGDVRVLSSPRLSVMNNQTAILRVTRDIIYFTITPAQTSVAAVGSGTVVAPATFTTTPNIAAEGFMMAVLPQINEADAVVLNVRPTIRRRVDSVRDPNPALQGANTQNDIPVFETREFDSILRLQSGEIAVLAGLMQDFAQNSDSGIPGIRSIPIIGEALSNRAELSTKTELVIFLRATVIRDPSLEGDFRTFRDQLPRDDFFSRPNPVRTAPPVLPGADPRN